MATWVIRGGIDGEYEEFALDNSLALMGWAELPDLSGFDSGSEIRDALTESRPDLSASQIGSHWPQLWSFSHEVAPSDWVMMPLHQTSELHGIVGSGGQSKVVAVGRIEGPYAHQSASAAPSPHALPVDWIATIPLVLATLVRPPGPLYYSSSRGPRAGPRLMSVV